MTCSGFGSHGWRARMMNYPWNSYSVCSNRFCRTQYLVCPISHKKYFLKKWMLRFLGNGILCPAFNPVFMLLKNCNTCRVSSFAWRGESWFWWTLDGWCQATYQNSVSFLVGLVAQPGISALVYMWSWKCWHKSNHRSLAAREGQW